MAKTKELREKTEVELKTLLQDKREALAKFHFQVSHGKTKNVKEGREVKKDIAKIITLLQESVQK